MTTEQQLRAELEQLKAENELLKQHAPYGILTRQGLEIERRNLTNAQYVIFADIDDMHGLNARHGYEAVNSMIRSALQLRHTDLLLTGLWFSGDEIVFVIASDPIGFCSRVQVSFASHEMGITLAYETIYNNNLNEAIDRAANNVQTAKLQKKMERK